MSFLNRAYSWFKTSAENVLNTYANLDEIGINISNRISDYFNLNRSVQSSDDIKKIPTDENDIPQTPEDLEIKPAGKKKEK